MDFLLVSGNGPVPVVLIKARLSIDGRLATGDGTGLDGARGVGRIDGCSVPKGPGRPGRGKAWPGLWEFSGAWTGPSL